MLAAFHAREKKVSVKTAKKIAAEYHDSVSITKRRSGTRPLVMPALIVGTALASLLLLGFVYPNVWSDWTLSHTGRAIEQTVRPVKEVSQLNNQDRRDRKVCGSADAVEGRQNRQAS